MNSPIGPSGWHPDPFGRFEYRYHNGQQWTADVSVGGQRFVDPQWSAAGTPPPTPTMTSTMLPVNTRSRAMAISAFIVGLVSALSAWLPFVFVASAVGAVLAFVFGILGIKKSRTQGGHGRGFAITGIVLSVAAALLCVVGFMFTRVVLRFIDPAPHKVLVATCEQTATAVKATGTIQNLDDAPHSFIVVVAFQKNGEQVGTESVAVDDVPAGETAPFEASLVDFGSARATCVVTNVFGPAPFDLRPGDVTN